MAIITSAFVWLVSVAESIILTVMSFFAVILMLWTFTMAGILAELEEEKMYKVRSQKKYGIIWEFFPIWGRGVFPIPKNFVN